MEFLTYKRYSTKEQAQNTGELLASYKIQYQIDEYKPQVALGQINDPLAFTLKILGKDFEYADRVLANDSEIALNNVSNDHYLFEFSDEELIDILTKPDEWSPIDYQLAQKILNERGKAVNADFLQSLRKRRIEELRQPEPPQKNWILTGYVASVLGGIIGLGIGLHLWKSKKTLPNGDKVYSFIESDRKQGKRILYLSVFFLVFWLIVKILADSLDV